MSDQTLPKERPRLTILRDVGATVMHRIDAWGIAFLMGILAILVHASFNLPSYVLAVTVSFSYLFGYIVNDYFDAPDDARDDQDEHRNLFVLYSISRTQARISFVFATLVILSGFLTFGLSGLIWFMVSIGVIWAYSAPPIRLKFRPGLDLIAHAIFVQTYPYLLFLILLNPERVALDYFILAICFFSSLTGQLAQQIRDYDVDLLTGNTFTTHFGLKPARVVLSVTTLILGVITLLGFLFQVMPTSLLPFVLLFTPTFLYRIRGVGQTSRSYAIGSVVLALGYVVFLIYHTENGSAL